MKTDLFQFCGHCWVFQICWHIECSTFTASSFRIWNSSTGIPLPPLSLFVVMLSKAHLTSHSRMSGSRWMITQHCEYLGREDFFVQFCVFLPYEWSCAPSLTSRTSSSFTIPCISASLRRSRDSPMEEEIGLLDIWLFLRHEHRVVLLWNSGRNPLLFPLILGHRTLN